MIRLMLGWAGRLVLGAAALVLVLTLLWLVIGRYDVSLSPEAQACEQPVPSTIPPEDNAYFAMVGLHAADPAADTNRVGRALLEDYVRALDENPATETYEFPRELKSVGNPGEACRPLVRSCLPGDPERIDELEQDNALLLRRYYSLYSYSGFRDVAPMHGYTPAPSYGASMHPLVLARIALQSTRGQRAQALEALARDTAFWRMLLGDDALLSRAIGIGKMLNNLRQLSDILSRNTTLSATEQSFVEQMLEPLSAAEQDWKPVMRREFCVFANAAILGYRSGMHTERSPPRRGPAHLVLDLAFRLNHTKNLMQEQGQHILAGDVHRSRHFGDSWWDYAYNPMGKYLTYTFFPEGSAFVPYQDRLKDLDGLMRLVTLQWEMTKQGVRAAEVPAFLDAHAALAENRATGHKVRWDAKRNVLWLARFGARQGEQNVFEAPLE